MVIGALDVPSVAHVLAHLREGDRREVAATIGDCHIGALAATIVAGSEAGFVAIAKDQPAAFVAFSPITPGVLSASMLATREWPRVALSVTRHLRRSVLPALAAAGTRRIEARSIAGHAVAHRWLLSFGARREADLAAFGQHGETFKLFALVTKEPRHVHDSVP